MNDLWRLDAVETARLIRNGEVTPMHVLEAAMQRRQIVRMAIQDLVVDCHGAADLALAAGFGRAQAQQADDVRQVAMGPQLGRAHRLV